jgi:hypothetical protein
MPTTTTYKLLVNEDNAIFKKDGNKIEISITNPKNISAYEIWDSEISNNKPRKIFNLSYAILIQAITNYNVNVLNQAGFTYTPTATVLLDHTYKETVGGGLLYIENIYLQGDTVVFTCIVKHNLFVEEINTFPENFTGKIRININGFQSTSLLNVVETDFIKWLDPVYNRLAPYPYTEPNMDCVNNMEPPSYNFLCSGNVKIDRHSNTISLITIENPNSMVFYEIWDPVTHKTNVGETLVGSLEPAQLFYTLFNKINDEVLNTPGADQDKQLFRPSTTFDLKDDKNNSYSLIGTIVDVISNFETDVNTIQFKVDTSNYIVYPNKYISPLPSGNFNMFMEIDGIFLPATTYTPKTYKLPELTYVSVDQSSNPSIQQIAENFYNMDMENSGSGQKIGIYTGGKYWALFSQQSNEKQSSDLEQIKSWLRSEPGMQNYNPKITLVSQLTSEDIKSILPLPYQKRIQSTIDDDCAEAMLDLNMVSLMLPNIVEIVIYILNSASDPEFPTKLINSVNSALTHAREHNVNSISWSQGFSIPDFPNTDDDAFFFNILGSSISLCVGSGDNGGQNGVNYPSASKYVVSVGGTELNDEGKPLTGWSGSGGGVAESILPNAAQHNFIGTSYRQCPDIAAFASPYPGWYCPVMPFNWQVGNGGTSSSAPFMASIIVRINQARHEAGLSPLAGPSQGNTYFEGGQFTNVLYNNYESLLDKEAIRDITTGNTPANNSKVGYDNVTGLGSIYNIEILIDYFVNVDPAL